MREEFRNLGKIKRKIIKELWKSKERRREQLVKELGISRTTVYDNLGKGGKSLLARGVVNKRIAYEKVKGRGRPPVLWSLTKDFIDEIENQLKKNLNQ